MTNFTSSATPYADAARVYRALGWNGVLPADLNGRPGHVPGGYTGASGGEPTDDQVETWRESHGDHNVALRLPDGVLGIDVDVYGEKHGDQTIEYLATQLDAGDLPATWTSTARGADQPSRIHLFRVPLNVNWRSDLGRGSCVEIIRRAHRWARVWPSANVRLLGRGVDPTYRWYRPDGTVSDRPPRPDELAELPASWIALLRDDGTPNAVPPGADRSTRTGDHRRDDGPVLDQDGQPVDPDLVIDHGIPIGSQQVELFRYMCSLRARNLRRSEMIALGMIALQRMPNDPNREPWTPEHVVEVVDHVRRDYGPGSSSTLTPAEQAWADRLRTATFSVDEPVPTEESATDLGNSLRFARLFRDRARYAADIEKWYVWDGQRWAPDRTNRVLDLTKHVIDDVRRQAFTDDDHRDDWLQWANRSESLNRRTAMIAGAVAEPDMVVLSDVFDRDSDLLVVRNGTVDLRTGELRESRPDDLCSHLAEVDFDADAPHERWSTHVALMCKNDPELIAYLARAVGYSLTGSVGARAFFFLEGTGSNGKNAFIEPIMQLMGSYAQTSSTALLTGDDRQHATILADLLGARLIFIDETRQGRKLNVERIKALTGSKIVKGRFMRKDFFDFEARFKLWIAGNGRPTVDDPSDGVWDRMHRVVCHGKVDPAKRVDRFGDVLYAEESSGILNWALAGLLDWRTRGMAVPDVIRADVEEYRDEEDYEAQFVSEWLEVTGNPADRLVTDDVYTVYQYWAQRAGLARGDVKNKAHLGRHLKRLGAEPAAKPVKINGRATRLVTQVRWQEGAPLTLPLGPGEHGPV